MTDSTIALTNAHGLFKVDTATLERALIGTASMSLNAIRTVVEGSAGYDEGGLADSSWIELLIVWVESGNHPFHPTNQEGYDR